MKNLLLFVFLLSTHSVYSQNTLELTPSGLKLIDDNEASYMIFEKSGTQQELCNTIKSFIGSRFVSPQDVISENTPTSITLNGVAIGIMVKKFLGVLDVKINYTMVFYFKDGKIRIDMPSLNRMTSMSSSTFWQLTINQQDQANYGDQFYIFNKKGELKNESAKTEIENYFNQFIKDAIEFKVPTNENW